MLINELEQKTSLSRHTIRFYEREGLLDDRFIHRQDNKYRHYTDEAVERLEMIKQGQTAGFTLSEIRELLDMWDSGELTVDFQVAYFQQKVDEITEKITQLERMRSYLSDKLCILNAPEADISEADIPETRVTR